MKCEQVKQLIRETSDLNEACSDQKLLSHLHDCGNCQKFLDYEKSLRKGFEAMANEAPPAELAARIFSIAENEKEAKNVARSEIFAQLQAFLQGFPLKTAFVSCLVGFFAAVLMLKVPEQKARVGPSSDAASFGEQKMKVASSFTAPSKDSDSARLERKKEIGGQIPGAYSFSISSENEAPAEKTAKASRADFRSAPSSLLGSGVSDRKRTMLAPESSLLAPSSREDEAPVDDEAIEVRQKSQDGRCEELESLIASYQVEIEPGFIDLRDFVARGIIAAEDLGRFETPAGSSWFAEIQNGKVKIFLKNEK